MTAIKLQYKVDYLRNHIKSLGGVWGRGEGLGREAGPLRENEHMSFKIPPMPGPGFPI